MAIKPILFNTEMVLAILDGMKTQTRRIIKGIDNTLNVHHVEPAGDECGTLGGWDFFYDVFDEPGTFNWVKTIKAPCSVGDVLWVRETWSTHYDGIHDDLQFCYKADGIDLKSECLPGENNRWYPSIHMPKEAARIFLKVNNVRVERLQEITPEEVEAEGTDMDAWYEHDEWQHQVGDGFVADGTMVVFETLSGFFGHRVWDNTMQCLEQYEKYGWDANPWVWVIEFERAEKPERW